MNITFEATYENGVLKPTQPLPLKERERVQVTLQTPADIQAALDAVERGYGVMGWTGDPKLVERLAIDPALSRRETP